MRILSVLTLAFVCSLNIYAQTDYALSGTVVKLDNVSLDKYGALLLDDSCAFHVVDKFGENIVMFVNGALVLKHSKEIM